MNTPMLDDSGRTMPLSELVAELRLAADEQIDKIDGAEESRGHDSERTALSALLMSAALAIESLALRLTRSAVVANHYRPEIESLPNTDNPEAAYTEYSKRDVTTGMVKGSALKHAWFNGMAYGQARGWP